MFFNSASNVVLPFQDADAQVLVGFNYDVDVAVFEEDQQVIHSGREVGSMAGTSLLLSLPQAGEKSLQAFLNVIIVWFENCFGSKIHFGIVLFFAFVRLRVLEPVTRSADVVSVSVGCIF